MSFNTVIYQYMEEIRSIIEEYSGFIYVILKIATAYCPKKYRKLITVFTYTNKLLELLL